MPTYLPQNYAGYVQGDPDQEPDENDDDGGNDGEASPEAQEVNANNAAMAAPAQSGYMPTPADDSSGPLYLPGMVGVTPEMMEEPLPPAGPNALAMSAGIPPPPPNRLQRLAKTIGLSRPQANTPSGTEPAPTYSGSLENLRRIASQYPQRQVPNWLERAAAGALGAAAGWSNAARRAAPIDIKAATEPILYPGYDAKVAAWQSQVAPAEKAAEIAGQQAAAGWKGQQVANEAAVKQAQAWMYLKRGGYYDNLGSARTMLVTQEMETATNGELKAGTTAPGNVIAAAINRTSKSNPILQKAQQLRQAFPGRTEDEIWQAVANPAQVGRAAPRQNESQVKDQQLRADYATAVGKDPTAVSDAEMNAARRMFSTSDDLSRASLREFIYKNKRLPNPAEERQIVNRSIQERGAANRAPVVAPTAFTAPITYTDKTGTLLHFDTQAQLDGYKKAVGE